MKRLDQITAAIILAASLWYIFEALKMPMMAGKAPGAGWMPLLLGVVMGLLSILLLVTASRRPSSKDTKVEWPRGEGMFNNVAILVGLAVSVIVLETAGYLLSTLVFLVVLMKILGKYSWKLSIAMSVIFSATMYWVFKIFLEIPLPSGLINF